MPDNLYSPGQKVLSKEGRDNWDAIFGKKRNIPDCDSKQTWDEVVKIRNNRDRFWFAQDIKE